MMNPPLRHATASRQSVRRLPVTLALIGAAAFAWSSPARAGITDPAGDFLATFAGGASSGDLDVLSASVSYSPGSDTFVLRSTLNGAVGSTPKGFYVWGVNTGTGVTSFAANGLPNVRFNQVVLLESANGNIIPSSGALLPDGSVTIAGDTLTAVVSGALLPSTGFAKSDYQWNLWPRDGNFTGFPAISDFAPDNTDFATTLAVPEPGTYSLMCAGLALLGWKASRRRDTAGSVDVGTATA